MEPIEYIRILLRRWPLIAVCALIGAGFAFAGTDPEPEPIRETYLAKHTLLSSANEFGSQQLIGTITLTQVPIFATTGEVPRLAAEQLGYNRPPAVLASNVTVFQDPSTGSIEFSTVQDSPDDAVRIADTFADITVRYLAEQQAQIRENRLVNSLADIDRLETEIRELDEEIGAQLLAQAQAQAAGGIGQEVDSITGSRRDTAVREYSTAYESYRELTSNETTDLNLTTLERAQPVPQNTGGFAPPRTRSTRVPIAALLGAMIGAGLALLAERLDSKLSDRRKAEEAFGAAVVAEIPSLSRKQRAAHIIVGPEQNHGAAEAFRSLRTSLTFMAAGGQPSAADDRVGVLLVTSPAPSEGKTTTAVNLAAAFAETGRRTVVVNADFRRPIISSILTDQRQTLPAGLAGIDRLDPEDFLTPTNMPGIELLDLSPLGDSPGDLTRGTYRLVAALTERVDVIIIDTPPLAVTTEALEFVPLAAVALLVGRVGRTATDAAQRAGELVRFGGAEHIAIALTDAGSKGGSRSAYYDYYGTGTPDSKRSLRRRKRSSADAGDASSTDGPTESDAGDDTTESDPGDDTTFDDWGAIDPLLSTSDDGPTNR
jgi:succinoglycan biosynthesis transport protein ExoP